MVGHNIISVVRVRDSCWSNFPNLKNTSTFPIPIPSLYPKQFPEYFITYEQSVSKVVHGATLVQKHAIRETLYQKCDFE